MLRREAVTVRDLYASTLGSDVGVTTTSAAFAG
jgi:hypothetical protein